MNMSYLLLFNGNNV